MPIDYDNNKEREARNKAIRDRISELESKAASLEQRISDVQQQTRNEDAAAVDKTRN